MAAQEKPNEAELWSILYSELRRNHLNFYLSRIRDKKAAKRFFKEALQLFDFSVSFVITADKTSSYPGEIQASLNDKVEQDHRLIRSMLGLKLLRTVPYILCGTEAMHILKKKQIYQRGVSVQNQKEFIPSISCMEWLHKLTTLEKLLLFGFSQ